MAEKAKTYTASLAIGLPQVIQLLPFFLVVVTSFLFTSCATPQLLTKKEKKSLHSQIVDSPVFSKNHTGFALYDPGKKELLYETDADILFTPASNTKIFTLYTALNILGDSIPALRYVLKGDSLIFWGTGDPSLWHPSLPANNRIADFLRNRSEQLYYCPDNFMDERFGAGWAWDDYVYGYQVEKSALPMYGNVIRLEKEKGLNQLDISPAFFSSLLNDSSSIVRSNPRFKRGLTSNQIHLEGQLLVEKEFTQTVPFRYSDSLVINLLQAGLGKQVELISGIQQANYQTIYSLPSDTVYQVMMQESDNFLAEQLLLLCANELFDTLHTRKMIRYAQKELLADLPDPMRWVDGSGLSRYNLFTPRSIVRLLEKIYEEISLERLLTIFPAGGESGTIEQFYSNAGKPFIYAKTGTLSNRHCLSGFLLTKSGKWLIFSFMHNNYYGSSKPLKQEMDKVLRRLYEEN